MNSLKISVITVTLNDVLVIENTIKSVLNQSYKNIEYIVIDGGSTDGALDIIEKYKDKISYFVSEPDKGIYNAMNKGAKHSTGKYLYFLNAGDTFSNEEILKEISVELDEEVDLLYGRINVTGKKVYVKGNMITKFGLRIGKKISQQAMFVKKETFNKIGGLDERYKIASDFNMLCKIFDNNLSVKRIDRVVCNYDSSGISSNLKKSYDDTARVIKDRYGKFWYSIYLLLSVLKLAIARLISY